MWRSFAVVGLLATCAAALADGGTPRLLETRGGYRVAVFTNPTPLRAGPVDFSILVQDAASGAVLQSADVTVRLRPRSAEAWTITQPATTEAATNKLFRAAVFELPSPGAWELEVRVDGPPGSERFALDLDVAEPPPRWVDLWPWFTWPLAAVVLLAVRLAARRTPFRPPGS